MCVFVYVCVCAICVVFVCVFVYVCVCYVCLCVREKCMKVKLGSDHGISEELYVWMLLLDNKMDIENFMSHILKKNFRYHQ